MTTLDILGIAVAGLGLYYYSVRLVFWLDAKLSAGVDSADQEASCELPELPPEIPSDSFAD